MVRPSSGSVVRKMFETIAQWFARAHYYGSGFFLLQGAWKRPAPARVIREGTNVSRAKAVLIGLEVGGRPRALAVDPCADKATGEGVRLLERDRL